MQKHWFQQVKRINQLFNTITEQLHKWRKQDKRKQKQKEHKQKQEEKYGFQDLSVSKPQGQHHHSQSKDKQYQVIQDKSQWQGNKSNQVESPRGGRKNKNEMNKASKHIKSNLQFLCLPENKCIKNLFIINTAGLLILPSQHG